MWTQSTNIDIQYFSTRPPCTHAFVNFVSCTSDIIAKTLTNVNTQAPEASLAEVCWLGWQSNLQKEAEERLKLLDVAQERKRGKVTELQKQSLPEEARLADTMRDMVGREVRILSEFLLIKYITRWEK